MIEAYLRPLYQYCLANPIAKRMKHFQPERITYLSCALGLLVAPALILHFSNIAIILLLTSGFLDTLDGSVARLTNRASEKGSLLDILSDRAVEFAVIFGLFAYDPAHRSWLTLVMLGCCYLCVSCFLTIGIFTPNQSQKNLYCSPGLIERVEAFVFFILMIWFPEFFNTLASLFVVLLLLTSYLHIKHFITLKNNETNDATQINLSLGDEAI